MAGSDNPVVIACAGVGAFLGVLNTMLGLFNYFKARGKDRREALLERIRSSQHLVKADYRRGRTSQRKLEANILYIVNTDPRPVTKVSVHFVLAATSDKPAPDREIASMGGNESIPIEETALGTRPLCQSAHFVYTDADGNIHEYTQSAIPRAW